ncbi:hypothetical protein [Rhodoferax sp.]|uniref:hypothetical protein n=1 Tax=Rhodoferax sp. TaxID=50421 RepID=UPI0025EB5716|nr:hypothetical protein [Rhodoferax sp.]
MVSITANSSAAPSLSATVDKTRVIQARRDAEQAQSTADDLRRQADSADRTAQVSQDNARSLAERSNQLVANYVQTQRGASNEPRTLGPSVVSRLYADPPSASLLLPPVVNAQGQATGQLVNLSA